MKSVYLRLEHGFAINAPVRLAMSSCSMALKYMDTFMASCMNDDMNVFMYRKTGVLWPISHIPFPISPVRDTIL